MPVNDIPEASVIRIRGDTFKHKGCSAILERQAAWLRRYPNVRLLVEGNCDERGTREYNLALGARRAAAARDYIVSLGISGDRMTTVSYGKERPMDPRSNEQAWSVNRNAHSTIVSGAVS